MLDMISWTCPRVDCQKTVRAYSQIALTVLIDAHIRVHTREDDKLKRIFQHNALDRVSKLAEPKPEPVVPMAIQMIEQPKDYNVLKLSLTDIGFLKTRGIALDDKIELDLVTEYREAKTELDQVRWSRILNSAWSLDPGTSVRKYDPTA
jgi:hypothetical protein